MAAIFVFSCFRQAILLHRKASGFFFSKSAFETAQFDFQDNK